MINEKCAFGLCEKPLKITESEEEKEKENGDEFWMIIFTHRTYFFCSSEHCEEFTK